MSLKKEIDCLYHKNFQNELKYPQVSRAKTWIFKKKMKNADIWPLNIRTTSFRASNSFAFTLESN